VDRSAQIIHFCASLALDVKTRRKQMPDGPASWTAGEHALFTEAVTFGSKWQKIFAAIWPASRRAGGLALARLAFNPVPILPNALGAGWGGALCASPEARVPVTW
jgi:hypothetical protein